MFKNYFKIALRSLWKHKAFSLINILGLAVGMTACFLIFLYVRFETSFDNFHSKADRIYRVVSEVRTPTETIHTGLTTTPVAINLKRDFPEVEEAVRLGRDGLLVRKGDTKFQETNTVLADSGLFKVFDFPLIEGDRNTALREPMSVILSETAAKKYFGTGNAYGQHLLLTGAAINRCNGCSITRRRICMSRSRRAARFRCRSGASATRGCCSNSTCAICASRWRNRRRSSSRSVRKSARARHGRCTK